MITTQLLQSPHCLKRTAISIFSSLQTMLDSGRKLLENPVNSSHHAGELGNVYGGWEAMDFDSRTKLKPALNYDIFKSWNGRQVHLRDEGFESGLCLSPQRSPQYYRSNFHSLSPSSKSQAIACGQKELMEMVSHMPESCYELSLRDLVEQPMVLGRQEEKITDERDLNMSTDRQFFSRESSKNKKESRALISKSTGGIQNGGFYLKMGFPRSLGSTKRKKKKNDSALNTSAKVSPRPPPSADKEWWKKRFTASCESESVGSSNISGSAKSSGSRSSGGGGGGRGTGRHASGGCWSWIYPKYDEPNE